MSEALPFKVSAGFTSIPNVIFTHYSFYPKFNGTHIRVYAYLLKLYNNQYGYAFPTQMQAMKDLGISDRTFRDSVSILCDMRLIRVEKNPPFNNNVYYFEQPIERESDFFAVFPQAAELKKRKLATVEKMAPKKAESKRKLIETQAAESHEDISEWL